MYCSFILHRITLLHTSYVLKKDIAIPKFNILCKYVSLNPHSIYLFCMCLRSCLNNCVLIKKKCKIKNSALRHISHHSSPLKITFFHNKTVYYITKFRNIIKLVIFVLVNICTLSRFLFLFVS